jgi:hypothetical protein
MDKSARRVAWILGGVVLLLVVVLLVAVWAVPEFGGETYKGKRASEWRRMADDLDRDTKIAGYRGLVGSHQLRELESRFDREAGFSEKLIIANAILDDPAMRPKVIDFLKQLLTDRVGDAYFTDADFRDVVLKLASRGESGPIEPLIQQWTTKGINPDSAKELLQLIAESKPKTGP